jgi:Flp pilus assembly pilin Flp
LDAASTHTLLTTFVLDAFQSQKSASMIELARKFLSSCEAATAIEYALIGSGVALVIVVAVANVGSNLSANYNHIANAFP